MKNILYTLLALFIASGAFAQGELSRGELNVSKKGDIKFQFSYDSEINKATAQEFNDRLSSESPEVEAVKTQKGKTTIEFKAGTTQDRIDKVLLYASFIYGYSSVKVD